MPHAISAEVEIDAARADATLMRRLRRATQSVLQGMAEDAGYQVIMREWASKQVERADDLARDVLTHAASQKRWSAHELSEAKDEGLGVDR